ncbi:DUF4097 family beta strand repeat-containing protein [Pontibacter flavimaris]|uniref:DUF4097 domain-containing protein n=1 Tax=Pontibacter flavimaris TaxID=1797110 RepID=A0A1Q5P912_9BACT|nr:DUF4097 family beta strand repeat-containing protein [Pontibacter flavimaris]OKL38717.1 hypothetical protein A3841_06145 [Pontibacter flavimaris]
MKRSLFILILLALSAHVFAQGGNTEEIVVPLTRPNDAGSMEVSLFSGSIQVTGTKGKDVVIRAQMEERASKAQPKEEAGGLRRIANNSMGLTVTEQNNRVEVNSEAMNRSVNLEIQVPQNFNLTLSSVSRGDITVRNVNGNLEIDNVNGSIKLENVSGNALANTVNGTIKANFIRWDSKSPMAFSTLNGNVDITLPANSKFNAKLNSDRGEIYTDFNMVREAKQGQAKGARTEGGVYRVSTADFVTGKVNGGGAEIMVKSMNGNIYIRKSK